MRHITGRGRECQRPDGSCDYGFRQRLQPRDWVPFSAGAGRVRQRGSSLSRNTSYRTFLRRESGPNLFPQGQAQSTNIQASFPIWVERWGISMASRFRSSVRLSLARIALRALMRCSASCPAIAGLCLRPYVRLQRTIANIKRARHFSRERRASHWPTSNEQDRANFFRCCCCERRAWRVQGGQFYCLYHWEVFKN